MKIHLKNIKKSFLVWLLMFGVSILSYAQTSNPQQATVVNSNPTVDDILDALRGTGLKEMKLDLGDGDGLVRGDRGKQIAIFKDGERAGLGMDEGILFSTGNASFDLENRNSQLAVSNQIQEETYTDPDLTGIFNQATRDVVIYKFEVTLADHTSAIRVEFQFGSDEYPDYVGSVYNDAFGFFVRPRGNGATLPGGEQVINMARLPYSNNPISINTVNYGVAGRSGQSTYPGLDLTQSEHYINNGHTTTMGGGGRLAENNNPGPFPVYIEYNGLTNLITYDLIDLTPGGTYEFKIAIADASDRNYDSGVLIKKIHGTTGADLKIEKTIDMQDPAYGQQVKFTLKASNLGPYDATGTIVNDLLPSGYTYVSHSASKGTYDQNSGIWNIENLQAIHETVTLDIIATVNETGEYTNIATITSDEPDPNLENNLAMVTPNPLCYEDQIFYEDFGISDPDVNSGRATTSYMPSESFSFGTPFPASTNNDEMLIGNGHYAVVAPAYIKDGVDPNNLAGYNWTPGIWDPGAITDISGTNLGALLAVNTTENLDVFYKREITLEHDETYRASFWMYLLEGPAKIAIDIKEKSTGKLLGTYTTDTFSDGSSAKNKWSNVQLYFKVPPVEDIHCTIDDVYLEIRNDLEESSGSRFYIDNIGLTSLGSQCPMPADPLDIECPTKPLIITNPMLINQAKK